MTNTICPCQVCISGRRDSTKDAHHYKTIHRHMSAVYDEHYMSLSSVHKWQKRFHQGRTSLQDNSSLHACCVWRTLYVPVKCAWVAEEILPRMHITTRQLFVACLLCMTNTICPCQVCMSGRRDSAKDAHHYKTIHRRMSAVYDKHYMSLSSVHEWQKMTTLYVPVKYAWVAEEILPRTHIITRQFMPGTGLSSHYAWGHCVDLWFDPGSTTPPTLALPCPNETDVHECISSGRHKWGSHKEEDLGRMEDVKCFPAKFHKLMPHQTGSMGMSVIMQKDDSVWQHSRVFLTLWCITVSVPFLHSTSHWLRLHVLGIWLAEGACSRRRSSWLYRY